MRAAGDLRNRIGFYQLQSSNDGYGNTESAYLDDPDFQCSANVKPRLGGETVLAQRLGGTNLVNITVRQSSRTRLLNDSWKAKDERSGVEYNIRSIIDPYEDTGESGRWFELLCEKGVAITTGQQTNPNPGPYFGAGYFGAGYFGGFGV